MKVSRYIGTGEIPTSDTIEVASAVHAYELASRFWKTNIGAVSLHSMIDDYGQFNYSVKSKNNKVLFQIKSA